LVKLQPKPNTGLSRHEHSEEEIDSEEYDNFDAAPAPTRKNPFVPSLGLNINSNVNNGGNSGGLALDLGKFEHDLNITN
jgi:hypothetical protein